MIGISAINLNSKLCQFWKKIKHVPLEIGNLPSIRNAQSFTDNTQSDNADRLMSGPKLPTSNIGRPKRQGTNHVFPSSLCLTYTTGSPFVLLH